jgi:hypothetical protein
MVENEGERVARLDSGRVSRSETTPSGGLRVDGYPTRTGVFVYKNPDGTTRRELRHPDDVFAEASLATLRGAPVTIGHPRGPVTPANWKSLAVGNVGDGISADGKFVASSVLVQDSAAISAVGAGKLREVSCGYTCRAVAEEGVFEGEAYDFRQTEIKYNHLALLPRGAGRGGSEVALRIDSLDAAYPVSMTEVLDDRTDALELAVTRADAAEKKADEATARADAADAVIAGLRTDLALALDPVRVEKLVESRLSVLAQRAALEAAVRPSVGPDWKIDGKTDREIRVDAIQVHEKSFTGEGKSDDYVSAYFDVSMKNRADALVATGAVQAASVRSDAIETPAKLHPLEIFKAAQIKGSN